MIGFYWESKALAYIVDPKVRNTVAIIYVYYTLINTWNNGILLTSIPIMIGIENDNVDNGTATKFPNIWSIPSNILIKIKHNIIYISIIIIIYTQIKLIVLNNITKPQCFGELNKYTIPSFKLGNILWIEKSLYKG